MNATTATPIRLRGTAKKLRTQGVLAAPLIYFPDNGYGQTYGSGTRFESMGSDRGGVYGVTADGTHSWVGGVATVFWVQVLNEPVAAAVEPVQAPAAPATAPAAAVEGDELDGLKFGELMVLAKALKVSGRGAARIDALREGIRTARAAQG